MRGGGWGGMKCCMDDGGFFLVYLNITIQFAQLKVIRDTLQYLL